MNIRIDQPKRLATIPFVGLVSGVERMVSVHDELESQWEPLTIDTAPQVSREIARFFQQGTGFDQQLWSSVTSRWESPDPYPARVTRETIWVLPPTGDDIATTDCWLTIGFGKHVRVPCFKETHSRVTYWRFAEGRLQFAIYQGPELKLQRDLIPRR